MADDARRKVFVSFARDHATFLPLLFERLEAQDLKVWNYDHDGQEVPLGDELLVHLRHRISECDVFVPVVTPHFFESAFTAAEVRFALELRRGQRPRLAPLVSHLIEAPHAAAWPPPFDALQRFEGQVCRLDVRADVDAAVAALCSALDIPHRPLVVDDPRWPIMTKVTDEVRLSPRGTEREHATYARLMRVLGRFQERYHAGDRDEAQRLIELLLAMHQFEYGNSHRLYYPAVIRATLLASAGRYDECHAILNEVERWARDAGRLDGNLYSARGIAQFQAGRLSEAKESFAEAVRRNPDDAADQCNLAVCQVSLGEPIDLAEAFHRIDGARVLTGEESKVELSKAVALRNARLFGQAAHRFTGLLRRHPLNPDIVCEYAGLLMTAGRRRWAHQLLERAHERSPEHGGVLHRLVGLLASDPHPQRGMQLYRRLAVHRPPSRRNHFEAMRGLWRSRQLPEAQHLAHELLDPLLFPLPSSKWDFYCSGAACWVLRQRERAQYDFERSGFSPAERYERVLGEVA